VNDTARLEICVLATTYLFLKVRGSSHRSHPRAATKQARYTCSHLYSCRNADMGSTLVARRAGM
jgi:hypothetical protein